MSVSASPDRARVGVPVVIASLAALYASAFLLSTLIGASYNLAGGLVMTPPLLLVGWAVARRIARTQRDPFIRRIIIVGYVVKILASAAFFLLVFAWRGGDAGLYHQSGTDIAQALWQGRLSDAFEGVDVGTAAMELLAGLLYSVVGPTAAAGFVVFATLGFVASYLFFRAFSSAFPDGDHRLYAALVFLMPSMLFWTSSLGKEAWMMLGLGLVTLGAVSLLRGQRGTLMIVGGVAAAAIIRPHMAALALTALAAAPLAQRVAERSRAVRRGRVILFVVVVVVGAAATVAAQRTFGLDSLSVGEVTGFLERLGRNTSIGGSAFENVQTVNPVFAPLALISVLFRPFPHEVTNPIMALASLEALAAIALLVHCRRSVRGTLANVRRNGFAAYTVVYTILFALGYSFFNNLGLLVRERVQVLPFLFVLLAAFPLGRSRSR